MSPNCALFLGRLTKQKQAELSALFEDLDLVPVVFCTPSIMRIWRDEVASQFYNEIDLQEKLDETAALLDKFQYFNHHRKHEDLVNNCDVQLRLNFD